MAFFQGFLAIGTVDGSDNFTESTDSAYARQPWSFARAHGSILEGAPPVLFPVSAGSYTANAYAFFARVTGGSPILLYSLATPVTIAANSFVTFTGTTLVVDQATNVPPSAAGGVVVTGTPPAAAPTAPTVDIAHIQAALVGLPTSVAGLNPGTMWNNGGALAIA